MTVLLSPAHWMPSNPACATPAPTMPPTSAWLDEEGMPLSQVTMFKNIAPTSAPNTTAGVTRSLSISPAPIISATLCSAGKAGLRQYAAKLTQLGKPSSRERECEDVGMCWDAGSLKK